MFHQPGPLAGIVQITFGWLRAMITTICRHRMGEFDQSELKADFKPFIFWGNIDVNKILASEIK